MNKLRVASYNIRKAVGLDWRRDPDRVVDVLAEINADVVVLQEADKRIGTRAGVLPLNRLQEKLNYRVVDVSVRRHSHGWHGNAVLCRRDRPVRAAERLEIPALEPRGAVAVQLHEPEIEIIGVHLGLTRGMRHKQLRVLSDYVSSRPHPTVMAGDFNEWKSDIVALGNELQLITPGPSFHASHPRIAFDRFVLYGNICSTASYVHMSDLARRASDHLPIVMDLKTQT